MPSNITIGQQFEAMLDNSAATSGAQAEIESNPTLTEGELRMRWPVGLAGDIAKAIYRASYLPQQEVAIVSTLALLSGIAGRAYRTPTGATLSQYYLLVAPLL